MLKHTMVALISAASISVGFAESAQAATIVGWNVFLQETSIRRFSSVEDTFTVEGMFFADESAADDGIVRWSEMTSWMFKFEDSSFSLELDSSFAFASGDGWWVDGTTNQTGNVDGLIQGDVFISGTSTQIGFSGIPSPGLIPRVTAFNSLGGSRIGSTYEGVFSYDVTTKTPPTTVPEPIPPQPCSLVWQQPGESVD